jgi:hypothetical protein
MKFKMVEELAIEQQEVSLICTIFNVSKSGYYKWLTRPLSARKKDNIRLWDKIKSHWEDSCYHPPTRHHF